MNTTITDTIKLLQQQRDEAICKEWLEQKDTCIKPYVVFGQIGAKYGMTLQAVDRLLRRKGLYTSSRKRKLI